MFDWCLILSIKLYGFMAEMKIIIIIIYIIIIIMPSSQKMTWVKTS